MAHPRPRGRPCAWSCWLHEMLTRLEKVMQQNQEGTLLRQELLMPTEADAMPVMRSKELLVEFLKLVQVPGVVLRFHALKEGQAVVPWKLVLGNRLKESDRAHAILLEMCQDDPTPTHAPAASHDEAQPARATAAGHVARIDGGTPRARMMLWRFHNTQLHCFMNSCTWAYMWSPTYLPAPDHAWGLLGGFGQVAEESQATAIHVSLALSLS